ncbi:B12-binding domain-containing radical SAM protein [Patescibacteria group bacterium]|nr:B12-binding domain-containing radical SAM protein [Patescibacteria group bacterium]
MKKGNNRIYLLYPPISKQERYSSDLGSAGGEQIPLGIYCLAAYLREQGYEIKVTDGETEKLTGNQIIKEIKRFDPFVVGISSTTVAFHRALEMAKLVKKKFPKAKIILGGPHVTSNYKDALSFKEFDYEVLREGEITTVELLKAIQEGKPVENIKGIAYRKNGQVVATPPREYIKNLDELPFPAYDLIKDISLYTPDLSNYMSTPVINIMTSRGCPNQCTFCDRAVFGQLYREMSAERVVELIKYLVKTYKVREIDFTDDTFMINKVRFRKIFQLLKEEGISFYWTCTSRVNTVDFETLKLAKETGCWHIAFGVESGDEDILKLIKKNITMEQIRKAMNWCKQLGIKSKGYFIVGHPGDTVETINKTIDLACSLPLDDILVTINTPIPGSPQYFFIKEYGDFDESDWSKFNCWRPVFIPKGLSKELLLKKQREMYRKFYVRPRIVWRYSKGIFGRGGVKRLKSLMGAAKYLFSKPNLEGL